MQDANRQGHLFKFEPGVVNDGFLASAGPEQMRVKARARVQAMLDEARSARPGDVKRQVLDVNEILMRNMTKWLPDSERAELIAAYDIELARLRN